MEQVEITLLEDVQASPDGITVRLYRAGETYEVGTGLMSKNLAKVLVEDLKVAQSTVTRSAPVGAPGPTEVKTDASPVAAPDAQPDASAASVETSTAPVEPPAPSSGKGK